MKAQAEFTTILVRYFDSCGDECIEAVPMYDTERLADLIANGGEIIPQ